VDPGASVGGQVVCTGCLRRLDLVALAEELATLVEATARAGDPEVAIELWLRRLDLSDVERGVLDLLLQGYRVGQIAARTGASESTVRKRLRRLLAKTGTSSQAELVARCRTARATRSAAASAGDDVVVPLGGEPEPPAGQGAGEIAGQVGGASRRSRSPRT
jgi:DNA-binding CsgD family transcriptional regulator